MTQTADLTSRALELARAGRDQAVADLMEELRIPSVSTLPERKADTRRNADWLSSRLEALGFVVSITEVEGGVHPVLQADRPGAAGARTLTIYGHYDVQPPDPVELWTSPPFEPEIRDGALYARGAADNKGNHMAALKAIEYLLAAGEPGLALRFLMEGEEEIGGSALPAYIANNAARLKSDYTLIWDGGFDAGPPTLETGLRGLLYTELEAKGAAMDLHSGLYGGVAPNPLNTLARIIAELKGRDGRITIPGFYDDIVEVSDEEWSRIHQPPDIEALLKTQMGTNVLEGEEAFDPMRRIGFRPTLDVNGMWGGFMGEGSKTVIPSLAHAKVSMRLVPNQDPGRILESLRAYVQELSTPGVEVTVKDLAGGKPVLLPVNNHLTRSVVAAFEKAFGQETVFNRSGGSIPVTTAFQEHVGGEIVCSGIIQSNARPHSPDEWLALDNYHRGIEMLIDLVGRLAQDGDAGVT